jgi:desulfoferrodoxin (superoxide reductase-like protein)
MQLLYEIFCLVCKVCENSKFMKNTDMNEKQHFELVDWSSRDGPSVEAKVANQISHVLTDIFRLELVN